MTESKEANINQKSIRIVTWNCHQGSTVFLNKLKKIVNWDTSKNADIYVIQECPKPNTKKILELLKNLDLKCVGWAGHNNEKAGVGIFINLKKGYDITEPIYLPVPNVYSVFYEIGRGLNIFGVWVWDTKKEKYEDAFSRFLKEADKFLDHQCIIVGDLNLDVNAGHREKTLEIYDILRKKGLISAYHNYFSTEPGKDIEFGTEKDMTYYLDQKIIWSDEHETVWYEKSTHLDYVFVNENKIKRVEILNPDDWIYEKREWKRNTDGKWKHIAQDGKRSDHVPIVVDIWL